MEITLPSRHSNTVRAVPSIFLSGGGGGGKLCTPITGVFDIQTGFLVGRFVFTPTQKVASKTLRKTKHTDAFCLKLS